jgi:hypothetical protein
MLDQIRYQTISACLRPARIAVAYRQRADWVSSARRVIGSLSRVWGGAGDIVAPLNGSRAIAEQLLPMVRAYDPDHVAIDALTLADVLAEQPGFDDHMLDEQGFPDETPEDIRARLADQLVPEEEPGDTLAAQVDSWCSPFKGLRQEARTFDEREVGILRRKGGPGLDLSLLRVTADEVVYTLDLTEVDPMIALMVETRVGAWPAHQEPGLTVVTLPVVVEEDLPHLIRLAITGEVAPAWDLHTRFLTASGTAMYGPPPSALTGDDYLAATPFARTHRSLAKVHTSGQPPPLVCVVGDSADDHALAMLCDRVLGHGAWAPLRLLRDDTSLVGRAVRQSVRHLRWQSRVRGRPVLVTSASQPLDVVASVVAELRELHDVVGVEVDGVPVPQEPPEELMRPVPARELATESGWGFLADARSFTVRRFVPIRQATDELSFLTPVALPLPTAFEQLGEDMTWWIDVVVPYHQLPARTAIPSAALQHSAGSLPDTVVRASRAGLSFSSANVGYVPGGIPVEARLPQPLLRLPSAEKIFNELAAKHGAKVERSEAGRRAATAVEMWGGSPTAIAQDLTGRVRRLLNAFFPGNADGDYGDGYAIRGHGYLTLRHATHALQERETDEADEQQASKVLDRLLMSRVLRRGLLLFCDRCGSPAFYPIGTVSEEGFGCLLCSYPNRLARGRWYAKQPEPVWNYALDQVVRTLFDQHGDVPLLAATRLSQGAHSFLWAPELRITTADGKSKELDMCLVIDGQIVIGEAKSNDDIGTSNKGTRRAAEHLVQAAQLLTADQIVLATAQPRWKPGVVEALEQAIGAKWRIGPKPKITLLAEVTA